MKALAIKIYGSIFVPILVFFTPIVWMVFLVGLSTLIDTGFGIWKAKNLSEPISSKTCRYGLVPKIKSYVTIILLLYVADYFIVNQFTSLFISLDFVSTKLVSLALIIIEVRSMDESFEKVKGYSFIEKIFFTLRNIKKVKDEFQP